MRYAAFLRGVMPTNAKMPELRAAFESAGFREVKTVLGSGNVVFTATRASNAAIAKKAEAAMGRRLDRVFPTIVRSVDELRSLLASDPYAGFDLPRAHKRVVTFLARAPKPEPRLPIEQDGARVLCRRGLEAFTIYVPGGRSPVFMTLIERAFGREVTTRTWQTVQKVAR